jgi:hypothetical protein
MPALLTVEWANPYSPYHDLTHIPGKVLSLFFSYGKPLDMVSKTRKQQQKRAAKISENGGAMPPSIPSEKKSVHLKKTRPNMKRKMKWRLGLDSPTDIYEGFEDRKGVLWQCPQCGRKCRVTGFCTECATGVKSKAASLGVDDRQSIRKIAAKKSHAPAQKTLKIKRKK